jgi:molybdate transport system substrate-binding protein
VNLAAFALGFWQEHAMRGKPVRFWYQILVFSALLSVGASAQAVSTVTVFAAASLTDAFEAIATAFEAQSPNVEVIFNFGGSSTLAAQIIEGAPADVFASANAQQMQVVVEAGLIRGTPRVFARNRLVLITPSDNPAQIIGLPDVARAGVALIVAAPNVPIRDYTNTLLDQLALDPAYGAAYRTAVLSNIVSEEDNVRQISAKIALGEGDAGIVYFSDVTPDLADAVQIFPIPDAVNTVAEYPLALVQTAVPPTAARDFVLFVRSRAGQCILARWNFIPARGRVRGCE